MVGGLFLKPKQLDRPARDDPALLPNQAINQWPVFGRVFLVIAGSCSWFRGSNLSPIVIVIVVVVVVVLLLLLLLLLDMQGNQFSPSHFFHLFSSA